MSFLIHGLDPARFARWFTSSDAELAAHGARRVIADDHPGFPCRVSLEDAAVGDQLLLVHFEHHATASPYRAAGPIYVRRDATTQVTLDRVPDVFARRLLSVRGYDRDGMLSAAELVDGRELAPHLERALGHRDVAYLHVHYARPGCYAGRVERG